MTDVSVPGMGERGRRWFQPDLYADVRRGYGEEIQRKKTFFYLEGVGTRCMETYDDGKVIV